MADLGSGSAAKGQADRRERGLGSYAYQFGTDGPAAAHFLAEEFGEMFAEEAIMSAGGAAWHAEGLTPRERSIAVISTLVALGGVEDRLRNHVRLAHRVGLDETTFDALTSLLAAYVGFPRASVATSVIRREFAAAQDGAAGSASDDV